MRRRAFFYLGHRSAHPIGETPNLDAYTIGEFCARNGPISRAFYYVLRKDGKAPREMHVGGRVLISAEAAAQWRRDREATTVTVAQRHEPAAEVA